jgi:hypothetical protein
MQNKDVYKLRWQGNDIEISVETPYYLKATEEFQGYTTIHIEVRTIEPLKAPLPITDTGYKSIFILEPELTQYGGAVKYVLACIESESKTKEWKVKVENARQLTLFEQPKSCGL